MKNPEAPVLPAPPSMMASLLAGFDAVASRIGLIVFPLALDLLIWLGPHLKMEKIVMAFSRQMTDLAVVNTPEAAETLKVTQEVWAVIGERLNLMIALRTYPVGIPSLMVSRLPVTAPEALPALTIEIDTWFGAIFAWGGLSLIGLFAASLYFVFVARAALPGHIRRGSVLMEWPWASIQVLLLTLVLGIIFLALSIPASCLISVLALASPGLWRFGILIILGSLMWLIFPLLFSSHGIFVNHNNAWVSLRKGLRVTRMTLPTTGMFFLSVVVLSQGLDILWKVPAETSWFTLVGLLGHAFITSGLLAASFIYYREADLWSQKMMVYWAQGSQARSRA